MIVDAMNVVGCRPDGWWRDRDAALVKLVASIGEIDWGHPVMVVVDGRPVPGLPAGAVGDLELIYSEEPGPDAADRRIVEIVEGRVGGEMASRITVVTSDRSLAEQVAALGATVTGSRRFRDRLS
ncbi:MAG: NYN domain-containing protein [Acidimicrobiales bacterium]